MKIKHLYLESEKDIVKIYVVHYEERELGELNTHIEGEKGRGKQTLPDA